MPASKSKEGRTARHYRQLKNVWTRPGRAAELARKWLLRLWLTKGGGFYGFGYVVTFLAFELRTLAADISGSSGAAGFLTSQVVQYLIRISFESLLNAFLALIWPVYLLERLGPWGLAVIIGGYLAFRFGVQPVLETWFPQLRRLKAAKARSRATK